MLVRSRRGWEMPESAATPEHVFMGRRALLRNAAIGSAALAAGGIATRPAFAAGGAAVAPDLYPAKRNDKFTLDRPETAEKLATSYNNFYEFSFSKTVQPMSDALKTMPWMVTIDGMVEKPITLDAEELIRKLTLEERLYRHRCVETWAMAVPWTGFPLKALVELAKPKSGATYLRMETFNDPDVAVEQNQIVYPWPYVEGVTMAEATNELAFISTGIYGKPMPNQNGAPLRLTLPWKYGFKSIKSIVRFTFTDEQPEGFWQALQSSEYGFWANVNPAVPHPRWSQARERMLGSDEQVPTQIYNGYGEFVAGLYADKQNEPLFM